MKKKFFFFLVLLAAFLASRWLFKPGYFLMHDDLQMMRQLQMEKCFQDQQFPCRWVPDMGFGYGYPLFNFYPPAPYYIGQVFRWLSFSFVNAAKLTFALQFFLSGAAMFVLAADLWGLAAGLLAAVFYLWAPYHAVDVFIRGAMNEVWAFVWFPLILWAAKKLIEKEKLKYIVWLAFSYAMLLLTHNVMAFIFFPLTGLWIVYWLIREKKLNRKKLSLWGKLALSAFWSLGLAAFFTLPALKEINLTHVETMFGGYFDWRAHFTTINQLFFSRFWGYGPSVWGPEDEMPFPVGQVHWILALIIAFFSFKAIVFYWQKRKKIDLQSILPLGLFFAGLAYAFLAHQRSAFIWEKIRPLQLAQFPWRLLAGTTFCFSLLAGYLTKLIKSKRIFVFLLLLVTAFNWSYFRPEAMGPLPEEQKFSGEAWRKLQVSAIYDYLPKSARIAANNPAPSDWELLSGEVETIKSEKGTNWFRWQGEAKEESRLQVNIIYFPGWKAWLNGKEIAVNYEKELGRMEFSLPAGEQELYLRFTNTPIRGWSNLFSLLSWWALLMIVFWPKLWRLIPKN